MARLPLSGRWLDGMARAPIARKTEFRCRVLSAIARQQTQKESLVETNLGISDTIRALVPVGKNDLIYGRPQHNVSERGTLELALVLSKQSDAFLDVGANEGIFAFSVGTEPGRPAGASVHFFEPDVDLFNRVSDNVARSKLSIIGNNCAVSDEIGIKTFYRNMDSDLSGSLTDYFTTQHATLKVEMPTTTIADYLRKENAYRACLKIDVEGAGAAVWRGTKPALDRVSWMIFEIIGPESEQELPKQIISEAGWFAYYIRDRELVQSRSGEYQYRAPFYNWLFCRQSPSELARVLGGSSLSVLGLPPTR